MLPKHFKRDPYYSKNDAKNGILIFTPGDEKPVEIEENGSSKLKVRFHWK